MHCTSLKRPVVTCTELKGERTYTQYTILPRWRQIFTWYSTHKRERLPGTGLIRGRDVPGTVPIKGRDVPDTLKRERCKMRLNVNMYSPVSSPDLFSQLYTLTPPHSWSLDLFILRTFSTPWGAYSPCCLLRCWEQIVHINHLCLNQVPILSWVKSMHVQVESVTRTCNLLQVTHATTEP